MGLSHSNIRRIATFVRKITKAPDTEIVISETFQLLKRIAKINRLRVVYSPVPGQWTEWKSAPDGLEVWRRDEWPGPEKKTATVFFDPKARHSGFISALGGNGENEEVRSALDVVAPEVWSGLLLRSAVDRVQKASISEAELTRATLRARDEERRHIARELHDDLGQSLVSLKLELKWAEDHIRKNQKPGRVIEELSKAREDVGVLLDKIRDLSHTLYPRILDTLGLVAAVKEMADQAARFSQIRVDCSTQGKPRPLGKEAEIAIYRCCQEAMNNAIRHSEASALMVRVCFAPKEVRVTVEDDGKGFNPRALYDSNSRMMSSGFWTIRQRMADIGAAFRVSTAEGQGTVVEMIVPYSSREAHDKGKDKSTHRG
jgi:signal transduction histidine kinase